MWLGCPRPPWAIISPPSLFSLLWGIPLPCPFLLSHIFLCRSFSVLLVAFLFVSCVYLSASLRVGKGLCLSLGVCLSPSVFSFLPSPQVSPFSLAFTLSTLPFVILLRLSNFPFSSLPSPTRSRARKEWSQCPLGLRKGMVDSCC